MSPATVIPTLVYDDIEAGHDFLVKAFGLRSGGLQRLGDGTVVHGEVFAGDEVIWMHRGAPSDELESPRKLHASPGGVSVQIPDVDEHFARCKAAGARIDAEPADSPHGFRMYGARDPEGHRWWFFTPID